MRGMNRVILVGNVGKETEVKKLADGTAVVQVSLATTETFQLKDGTKSSSTQWHTVVLWRGLAELAGRFIKKGSLVLVEGRIMYRKYEDRDGVMRYKTEIVGDKIILLDRKSVDTVEVNEEPADPVLPF